MIRKSLALEIVNFVTVFNDSSYKKMSNFTQSAFIQCRNKIKPEVFKHLSSHIISEYYSDNDLSIKLWNGFRLLAVDGSRINLPNTKELEKIYGVSKNHTETYVVQARTSILYDVLNKFVIDSVLSPLSIGELPLAKNHLKHAKKNDLIIYDRGYPAFDLIHKHVSLKIDFLIRTREGHSNVIKAFALSDKSSEITEIQPCQRKTIIHKLFNKKTKIKVRLVAVYLENGTKEILITSLLDETMYETEIFKELYYKRWGVETYYDELKNKLKVEHFSGYSNNTIQQDFNAAIFISNIQSLIVNELEEEIQEKTKNRKLRYKVNTNLSYGFLKDRVISLLTNDGDMEEELKDLFRKHLIPIRPDRNFERTKEKFRRRAKPKVTKNQKDTI